MSDIPSVHAHSSDICRIALISTPRSGNTWVTNMVAKLFELKEQWAHSPADVDWENLRERIVLQLHWQRSPDFLEKLKAHGFRVVVMSRHPLDVLISILAYCQHDSSTLNWLTGAGGDERCLSGASPLSEPFLNYAIGPRAEALLGVSREWWNGPEVCHVRYEDLLEDCQAQMERVVASVGQPVRVPLTEVVEQFRPSATRDISVQFLFHVWSAQAGLWRQLIPATIARRIFDAHREVFETLGYECRPDETLTQAAAQTTWERLELAALKRNVNGLKRRVQECEVREHADIINLHKELHGLDCRSAEDAHRLGLRLDEQQCLHGQLADYTGNLKTRVEYLETERGRLGRRLDETRTLHDQLADFTGNHQSRVESLETERGRLGLRLDETRTLHDQLADCAGTLQARIEYLEYDRRQIVDAVIAMQDRLQELDGLGPWSLKVARKLHVWSQRFPTFAAAMKAIATRFSKAPAGQFSEPTEPTAASGEASRSRLPAIESSQSIKKAS